MISQRKRRQYIEIPFVLHCLFPSCKVSSYAHFRGFENRVPLSWETTAWTKWGIYYVYIIMWRCLFSSHFSIKKILVFLIDQLHSLFRFWRIWHEDNQLFNQNLNSKTLITPTLLVIIYRQLFCLLAGKSIATRCE